MAMRRNPRQHFAQDTWLDPEEYAYPAGSLRQSRRKFRAVLNLGVKGKDYVTGVAGIPDTYFTIPARGRFKGKTIHGTLTIGSQFGTAEGALVFTPGNRAAFDVRYQKNAPLHGAKMLGSNMLEVEHGDMHILYSYKTPVAIFAPGYGYLKTDKKWSVTTSRHIGKWIPSSATVTKVPQEVIEKLASTGVTANLEALLAEAHDPFDAKWGERMRGRQLRGNPGQHRALGMRENPGLDDPYPHPGKFEGETLLAPEIHEATMLGVDEELGEADGFGWYGLLTNYEASDGTIRHVIAHEDSQGFFDITEYDTAAEAEEAWGDLQDEYEEYIDEEGD